MNKRIKCVLIFGILAISMTACSKDEVMATSTPVSIMDSANVSLSNAEVQNNENEMVTAVSTHPTETPVVSPTIETSEPTQEVKPVNDGAVITFKLEAWADNWFAAYLGEEL